MKGGKRDKSHQCLYFARRYCWQASKSVRRSECNRCMLAYVVAGLYSGLDPRKQIKRWGA
jgi:hypothetical protein